MTEKNILLIGGHRKSGTTMLHSLFDSHPNIWTPPHDLNILYAYFPEWLKASYTDEQRIGRLKLIVLKDWQKDYTSAGISQDSWLKFEEYFLKNIVEIDVADINQVIDFLIEGLWLFAPSDTKLMVVKETSSEMYVPWLLKDRPNWKFLHLFRDPRDNYAALKAGQTGYYSTLGNDLIDTVSSTVIRYKFGFKWMQSNIASFGDDRYAVLRFEDLVEKTEFEMKKIACWLGVSWHDSLVSPTKGGLPFKGNSHDNQQFDKVSNNNVGRWRERIHESEAAIFEFVLKDEMLALGYDVTQDSGVAAAEASEWYGAMNAKYFFADRFK